MRKFLSQLLDSDQDDSYLLALALLNGKEGLVEFPGSDGRVYSYFNRRGVTVKGHPYIKHRYSVLAEWYLVWPAPNKGYLTTHIPGQRSRTWKR